MDIFLSASVPLPSRDRTYYESVDLLALREALKSLAEYVLPVGRITYGGPPCYHAVACLIYPAGWADRAKFTLFQSAVYDGVRADAMPEDNGLFADLRIVPAPSAIKADNVRAMREAMISSRSFDAAVFIGGMNGCLEELTMFRAHHPDAMIMPIATTGAAARMIFEQGGYDPVLARSRTYPTIFRRLLKAA